MNKPVTEKQIQFINTLREQALAKIAQRLNEPMVGAEARARLVGQAALIIGAPRPQTSAEASALIDALKGGDIVALAHRTGGEGDWGPAVIAEVYQILGDDPYQWPARVARDPRYVTEHRPGGEAARVQDGEQVTAESLRRTFAALATW